MLSKKGAIFLVLICTVLLSIGQVLMKKGSATALLDTSLFSNYSLILGYLMYAISGVLLLIALRYGELIILFPIITMSYIWIILLSFYIFDESMPILKILGVLGIMFGVVLIGVSKNGNQ